MYTLRQHFDFPIKAKTLKQRTAFINQAMLELEKHTSISKGDIRTAPRVVHESERECVLEFQIPQLPANKRFYDSVYEVVNTSVAAATEEVEKAPESPKKGK